MSKPRPQASFIWRKVVLVKTVNHLPKLNWASQFFRYIFLQNMNAGTAERVTHSARSPLCDNRVTLTTGPTFLHVNTPVCPVERTWSSQGEVISICEGFQFRQWGRYISHKRQFKLTGLGVGGTFLFECFTINSYGHYLTQLEQKTRCRKES